MSLERQFLVEILDTQKGTVTQFAVSGFNVVSSRVTGTTAGAAVSLVTFGGNGQTGIVGTAITVPPSVQVVDSNGVGVAGSTVTWLSGGGSGGTSTGNTSTTNSNGVATVGSWTMGNAASSSYSLLAYSGNLTNSPIGFVVSSVASGSAFSLAISGGTSQTSTPGGTWASRGSVLVTDQYANLLSNATVTLTTEDADGSFPVSTITTNTSGVAGFLYVVGTSAGTASVFANLLSSATSVTFTSTVTSGPANNINISSGDGQTALSNTSLANPIIGTVDDGFGNPVGSGNTLQYVVVLGSGNISKATQTPVASAWSFEWEMGNNVLPQAVEISLLGVSNSTVTVFASSTIPAADTLFYESGGTQTGAVATALSLPLAVACLGSGSSASGQLVTWQITSSNQTGSLSTTQTISGTSGVARTVLTLGQSVGDYQVTASAGTLTGSPIVFNATATAGSATSLALTTQPQANTAAGVAWPQQPVVVSTDVYGNLVSTNTRVEAVLFGSPAPNGTLGSGISTAVVASGATAPFSGLSYNGSGAYQTVYRCNSLSTATANLQNGAPPFASQLGFTTQPGDTIQGSVFSPDVVVTVQDSNGITVTTATNQATLAISGAGALNGTLVRNAVAGFATFSGVGPTPGTPTGSYTLSASATGLTGATSASFNVTSTSGAHPNEPAGFTQVTENDFALPVQVTTASQGLIGPGWYLVSPGSANVTLQTDQSDMARLTAGCYRIRYLSTLSGGTAPCNFGYPFSAAQKKNELYLDYDFKVDPNWSGNSSGVNKMMFITAGGIAASPFYFSAQGAGQAALKLQVRLQACPPGKGGNGGVIDGLTGGAQNIGMGSLANITRGTKFRVECYAKMNSVDGSNKAVADGLLKVWFNGVLALDRTGMAFRGQDAANMTTAGPGPTAQWDQIKVNPTFGGGPPSPIQTQYFWLGYMYGSTK